MIGFGGAPNSLRVPLELLSNEAVRSAVQAGTGRHRNRFRGGAEYAEYRDIGGWIGRARPTA